MTCIELAVANEGSVCSTSFQTFLLKTFISP